MNKVYNNIMLLLSDQVSLFELIEHDKVFTAAEASMICKHEEYEGTKSLVLTGTMSKAVVTIPGNDRFNFTLLHQLFGEKLRMLKEKELSAVIGVELGCVSPIGYNKDIKIAISSKLFSNEFVYFNPGLNSVTIKLKGCDFKKIAFAEGAIIF